MSTHDSPSSNSEGTQRRPGNGYKDNLELQATLGEGAAAEGLYRAFLPPSTA